MKTITVGSLTYHQLADLRPMLACDLQSAMASFVDELTRRLSAHLGQPAQLTVWREPADRGFSFAVAVPDDFCGFPGEVVRLPAPIRALTEQ